MFHLTIATDGRVPLARTEDEVRALVRRIAMVTRPRLLLFAVADDHGHVVVRGDRVAAGRTANGLRRTLRVGLAAGLEPARVRPVEGRRHLERLVGYLADQAGHHGLRGTDALHWPGSCVQDLLGARQLPIDLQRALQEELPRWAAGQLMAQLGLASAAVPADAPETVRAAGACRLVRAAAAAFCAPCALADERPWTRLARRATVHLGLASGIAADELAFALGVCRDSVHRLRRHPLAPDAIDLLRRRLRFEALERKVQADAAA